MKLVVFCASFALFCLAACGDKSASSDKVLRHDHAIEYGNMVVPKYAKGFHLDYHAGYTMLVIHDLKDSLTPDKSYVLSTDASAIIKSDADHTIQLPLENVALLSTTHLAMVDLLDAWPQVKGLAYADKVMDDIMISKIQEFNILNLSSGWNIDREKILACDPQVMISYPYEDEAQEALSTASFPRIGLLEYAEPHPLGRVEWIKVLGLLFGKEDQAQSVFEDIEKRYIAAKAKASESSPTVFTGSFFQGQWSVPSGESLAAQLIADAGGAYAFAGMKGSENLTIDFERLVSMNAQIDCFGALGFYEEQPNKLSLAGGDDRLLDFEVFQNGQLFYCNTAEVDYFGRGVVEPHIMLQDLASIFQGQQSDHSFKYFFPFEL